MGRKHQRLIAAIFERPTRANIPWRNVEDLLRWMGAEVDEGRGSRIRVRLKGVRATLHRPPERSECGRGLVERVRDLLEAAGVTP